MSEQLSDSLGIPLVGTVELAAGRNYYLDHEVAWSGIRSRGCSWRVWLGGTDALGPTGKGWLCVDWVMRRSRCISECKTRCRA